MTTAFNKLRATPFDAILHPQNNADLAERVRFEANPAASMALFDQRSDEELLHVANEHHLAMERERALWEYGYRQRAESVPVLTDHALHDPEPSVRWNLHQIRRGAGCTSSEESSARRLT